MGPRGATMTIPAEKPKKMAEHVRLRNRERQEAIASRVAMALAEVERLVAEFRAVDPVLEKVVLFGSLVSLGSSANRDKMLAPSEQ